MTLAELRTLFIELSGRKDFETNTTTLDWYANRAIRMLDMLLPSDKLYRYQKDLAVGDTGLDIQYLRYLKDVWVTDSDDYETKLERKSHKWIRENFTPKLTDTGSISAAATANGGASVEFTSSLHGMSVGDTVVISGCTNTTYNSAFTITDVTSSSFTVLLVFVSNDTGTWATYGSNSGTPLYYSPIVVGLAPQQAAYTSGSHADFTYNDDGLIYEDHFDYKGITFMPAANKVYTCTVTGSFWSKPLSATTDYNYWTQKYPDTLIQAMMYKLESIGYRNNAGAQGYLMDIMQTINHMDFDEVSREIAEINQMGG